MDALVAKLKRVGSQSQSVGCRALHLLGRVRRPRFFGFLLRPTGANCNEGRRMKTLVWVEHDNASVKDATLAAVTAASQLGEVHLLVAGSSCAGGRRSRQDRRRARSTWPTMRLMPMRLAENVAAGGGPDGQPRCLCCPCHHHRQEHRPARRRVLLDVMQISDILSVEGPKTFTRPILCRQRDRHG